MVCVLVTQSCPISATPWIVDRQAPLSMGLSRQQYWSGQSFSSPGDLLDLGMESMSSTLQTDCLCLRYQGCLHCKSLLSVNSPNTGEFKFMSDTLHPHNIINSLVTNNSQKCELNLVSKLLFLDIYLCFFWSVLKTKAAGHRIKEKTRASGV